MTLIPSAYQGVLITTHPLSDGEAVGVRVVGEDKRGAAACNGQAGVTVRQRTTQGTVTQGTVTQVTARHGKRSSR